MPRLRNTVSGVVVNVDDATAKRLGAGWAPVAKAQGRKVTSKSAKGAKK